MKNIISNKIFKDSGIWRLDGGKDIDYSDGSEHENYLNKILKSAIDLSSDSDELTVLAKDWTSEYHLSKKRAQLLNSFKFDRNSSVLEVGCGCGAISRYLGETFDEVISIEGTFARAKLAKERTKDLETVNIVNAPFQDLDFIKKFDLIICVGVFEYSSAFISGQDPHDKALSYFSSLLKPNGTLIIAIENQFGLKYYSSGKEDHTNIMFDGIEGYPRYPNMARTFGKKEITDKILNYFHDIDFYYPYPDYKIPSLILSDEAFSNGRFGELISNFHSPRQNDYFKEPLFDETLALLELEHNNKLNFFANSFLIFANKVSDSKITFPNLGVFYSDNRKPEHQTKTTIELSKNGIVANKTLLNKVIKPETNEINLNLKECSNLWIDSETLELSLYKKSRNAGIQLDEFFKPCLIWINHLNKISLKSNKEGFVEGKYIDFIWKNTIIDNQVCHFIDNEWEYDKHISINALAIRAIYYFLNRIRNLPDVSKKLRSYSLEKQIFQITNILGLSVTKEDFKEFYVIEKVMNNNFNFIEKIYIKYTWAIEILSMIKAYTKSPIKYLINFIIRIKSFLSRKINS